MRSTHAPIEDLAIFGRPPLFAKGLPTGQLDAPNIEAFIEKLRSIFDKKSFSNGGPLVRALEERLCELHQVVNCIAVANAALGLTMLLQTLAGHRRGEVLVPAMGYRGLPHFAKWAGQSPRFVDVDEETHTLAPSAVEGAMRVETSCILAISGFNTPGFLAELDAVSARKGVPIIYDSVDSVASTYLGRPLGGFGRAEVFSLHATKLINGFEGGYITTRDDELARILRRQLDFNHPGALDRPDDPAAHVLGLNGKLNEIHAAMALLSLDRLAGVIERNKQRFERYAAGLAEIAGVRLFPYSGTETEIRNYRMVVIEILPDWPLTRDETVRLMKAEGAGVRAYFNPPLFELEPWVRETPAGSWPVTRALTERFLHLPTGELVSDRDIDLLIELLGWVGRHGAEIKSRLRGEPNKHWRGNGPTP